MDDQVRETVLITLKALADAQGGDTAAKAEAQKQITNIWIKPVVNELNMQPSDDLMEQIRERHQAYRQMAEADAERLREGDFSTSDLHDKAPPTTTADKTNHL